MQSKGIIKWLAVLLGLASIWQLSFSFVTRNIEAEAAKQENPQAYLDERWDKSVYLGYTYGECKEKELNLGLDLKGGMNVMLEIKAEDVIRTNAFNDITVASNNTLRESIEAALDAASAMESPSAVVDAYVAALSAEDLMAIYATDDASAVASQLKSHIEGSVAKMNEVLITRIDLLGVIQPNIQPIAGTNRIMVELPGVKEPERVSKLLASTANLEFWQVCDSEDANTIMQTLFVDGDAIVRDYLLAQGADETEVSITPLSELLMTSYPAPVEDGSVQTFSVSEPLVAAAEKSNIQLINEYLDIPAVKALIPADVKLAWSNKSSLDSSKGTFLLYALKGKDGAMLPVLDGSGITNARAAGGQYGGFEVSMTMDSKTAIEWGNITGANIGRQIAIVLDSYVYSAPRVNDRIDGGQSSITGNFTAQEAEDLANVLNSGKSPAPATIIYSEVVGPSLGAKSINAGLISFVLAFCLVLLYMAFFYKTAGWYANIALLFNVLLLFGVLVSFGAVLTLPGIAGIVLTMGMAVDANVIIFERVKEELRAGKGIMLAIKDGFSNAYSAIIDGNLTTIITGIVLFFFGTGPVKGFATTLVLGIITSLFCAIFITRVLIESHVERRGTIAFSRKFTENFMQNVKFSFISKRKVSYVVSGILIVASIISLFTLGLNQGVEFTGGRSYVVKFNETISVEDVRQSVAQEFESVADAANSSVEVKQFGDDNQVRIVTQYQPAGLEGEEANDAVDRLLFAALDKYFTIDDFGFEEFRTAGDGVAQWGIVSSEQVNESISSEMTVNSIIAVLIALVAIGLYIAVRFRRWQWAMGATVALAHNALLVIGIFSMLYAVMPFNLEVNQAFIAAILTIIGYSINDTVVIFDRIREYIGLYPKRDIKTNIDNAICATLSRTINTSGTTLVTLLAIFIFGGETIRGFVFALILGVIIGTYSSVFIATPIAYDLQRKNVKRGEEATEA
ncbi:MAG: protein translocase subunit SecDF [Rikenellaceae bacterium]|nr:protein translocase subunit SecDF [Rikenellaceae bacterium]